MGGYDRSKDDLCDRDILNSKARGAYDNDEASCAGLRLRISAGTDFHDLYTKCAYLDSRYANRSNVGMLSVAEHVVDNAFFRLETLLLALYYKGSQHAE